MTDYLAGHRRRVGWLKDRLKTRSTSIRATSKMGSASNISAGPSRSLVPERGTAMNPNQSDAQARTTDSVSVRIPAALANRYTDKASNPAKINPFGDSLKDRIADESFVTVDLSASEAAYFLADCDKPYPADRSTGKTVRDYVVEAVKAAR